MPRVNKLRNIVKWKTLSSKIVYQNPWMKIREDKIIHPDEKPGIYSVAEIAPGIFTAALAENDEIYLVKQLRYTTGINSWELPGGGQKTDEDPLSAAKRELEEEAGIIAKRWYFVGKSQALNGSSNQIDSVYVAKGISKKMGTEGLKEGISSVKKFSVSDILGMIKNGKISDGQTIAHILMALLYLGYSFTPPSINPK
jgi:hypothetical protein